jgi:hypothetical protein
LIRLEENNIKEIHCPKVGFLTDCHPRVSMVAVYEDRIKQIFHDIEIPPFYCAVDNVSVCNTTTKVIMIKSAEADVNRFLSLFRTATQENINTFIPWNQWIAMIPAKQLDLIQRQNGVLTSIKSIILSGFKDIEDIPLNYSTKLMDTSIMADDDDATPVEPDDKYRNATVNEFLKTNYKDIHGEPLFQFCYPVSLGIREMNVNMKHAHEAIHLCKTIKADMLQYMSDEAAEEIFEDVKSIRDQAKSHTPWVPYDIAQNYNPIESESESTHDNTSDRKKSKRVFGHDSTVKPSISYKQAATNNMHSAPKPAASDSNPTSTDSSTELFNSLTEEMRSFRSQLATLQKNQKSQDEKVEKNTTKLVADIVNMKKDQANTQNDVQSIKHQMQEMTTKTWMEDRFEKMDHRFGKIDKVMDFMVNFIHCTTNHTESDKMLVDKELLKRNNEEISGQNNDSYLLDDCDKENYASGGNQFKCIKQKTDCFGEICP